MSRGIFPAVVLATIGYLAAILLSAYVGSWLSADPFSAILVPWYLCTMGYTFLLPGLAWYSGYAMGYRAGILGQQYHFPHAGLKQNEPCSQSKEEEQGPGVPVGVVSSPKGEEPHLVSSRAER